MAQNITNGGDKTLLILGGGGMLVEVVEYAQSLGIKTIVTDYFGNSPAKKYADEAWDISTANIEELQEKCNQAGVTGIFTAFDDFNVRMAAALALKLRLPFYTTPDLAEQTMNKLLFKENCRRYGVRTMKEFLADDEGLYNLVFPVIVKPVDSSGSRGISVCRSYQDFDYALMQAKSISKSGEVIVEEYIEGDEVGANFYIQDGEIALSATHDRYLQQDAGTSVRLPLAYVYPSKYQDAFVADGADSIRYMFAQMGLRDGSLFMQGCVRDKKIFFYEMGYRLNAAKQYQIIKEECSFSPMEALIHYSMTGKMSESDLTGRANPSFRHHYCTLSLLIRPGKVGVVSGLDNILKQPEIVGVTQWCFNGDILPDSAKGTQKLIAARVTIKADNLDMLACSIDCVNSLFQVLDDAGNSLRDEAFNPDMLFL